jgi:transcriptional regulator with XRE-family HTH domain
MTDQEFTAFKKKFGKGLQKLRESKGLSLVELSYNCSLDPSKISKIEHGRFNITLRTVMELAKGLEVHPSELFE